MAFRKRGRRVPTLRARLLEEQHSLCLMRLMINAVFDSPVARAASERGGAVSPAVGPAMASRRWEVKRSDTTSMPQDLNRLAATGRASGQGESGQGESEESVREFKSVGDPRMGGTGEWEGGRRHGTAKDGTARHRRREAGGDVARDVAGNLPYSVAVIARPNASWIRVDGSMGTLCSPYSRSSVLGLR